MNVTILLAHPDKNSFNHAIAQTAADELKKNGHVVVVHDLYAEKFDPVLPAEEINGESCLSKELESHCMEIASTDGIIVVHPNWWGQPPALLKGWMDRVLRAGVAYRFMDGDKGEGIPIGLLKAKAAVVFNTSNTFTGREHKVFGDPLETIWRNCIFSLCGVENFYRETFSVIITSTPEQRRDWLVRTREIISVYFPA
jgi:NAD(P)H dehydrogenase (quinone)